MTFNQCAKILSITAYIEEQFINNGMLLFAQCFTELHFNTFVKLYMNYICSIRTQSNRNIIIIRLQVLKGLGSP